MTQKLSRYWAKIVLLNAKLGYFVEFWLYARKSNMQAQKVHLY